MKPDRHPSAAAGCVTAAGIMIAVYVVLTIVIVAWRVYHR